MLGPTSSSRASCEDKEEERHMPDMLKATSSNIIGGIIVVVLIGIYPGTRTWLVSLLYDDLSFTVGGLALIVLGSIAAGSGAMYGYLDQVLNCV